MLGRLLCLGLAFWLGWSATASADYGCCGCDSRGRTWVELGYRQDDFHWSIAGPDNTPNVLSDLHWHKLHMLAASAFGWHSSPCLPYLRWAGIYSAVMRGSVVDRDFDADNKHLEFSRSKASCNRGSVVDLSGGLGYPFIFDSVACGHFLLAPVVGIGWIQQHLHMRGGRQLIATHCPADLGFIHCLRSEYRTHWWGPWAGVDMLWECGHRVALNGSYEYHWSTRYSGRGDWNLRHDFLGGFTHFARGHGWVARFGGEFAFDCFWLFSLDFIVQRWNTKRGTDRTNVRVLVVDGKGCPLGFEHVSVQTPFNGAHWDSFSITGGIAYRY